jgi:purine nucleosidase
MHKIILDTDIGTDVDDLMALALILGSPELELLGITTAYGDTKLRAKLTHRVLEEAGRAHIPIYIGVGPTLNGVRPIFWPGHEGKNAGLERVPDSVIAAGSAEDYLIETVSSLPGEVTVLAVAPLGNLARAILKNPEAMRQVKQIVMMGGVFGTADPELKLPVTEHNIRCDPEAAHIVFGSGIPITLFPLDVTTKVELHPSGVAQIGRSAAPLAQLLHAQLETWLEYIATHHARDFTHMHDPLATAFLIDPGLVTRSLRTGIRIECVGEYTSGATIPDHRLEPQNVNVVLEVDAERFQKLFMDRVTTVVGSSSHD